jgi:hypothetical protein
MSIEDISRVRGLVTQPLAIRLVQQLNLVKTQDQTSLIRALLRLEQVSSCRAIIGAEAYAMSLMCHAAFVDLFNCLTFDVC